MNLICNFILIIKKTADVKPAVDVIFGAGDENRTHVNSLEGCGSTI